MARYVVTGGASGIGREVVVRLLAEGHEVYSLDRAAHDGVAHDRVVHVPVDLADAGAVGRAAGSVRGRLDGLVHIAGVPGTAPARQVLAVNLLAPRRLTGLLLPQLQPGGVVVTLASIAALRSQLPEQAVPELLQRDDAGLLQWLHETGADGASTYDDCKKLLVAWTSALAGHLVTDDVRAVSISPGPVNTPLLKDFRHSMGSSVDDAERALGRHAEPAEVAAAVLFALSAAASWLNGVDLRLDGGLVALRAASSAPRLLTAARDSALTAGSDASNETSAGTGALA